MGQSREERSGLRNLLRCDEAEGNPPRGSDFKKLGSLGMKTQGPLGEGAFRLRSFGPRNGRGGHVSSFGKKICSSGRGVALNRLTICIEYCIIIETMPNYTPYAKGAIRIDVKK